MKQYLLLVRPYGSLFLGFNAVFGAIANGENTLSNLSILFIIGILVHIFTFAQNDYYDVEIDSKSTYVSNRPLTAGVLTKNNVLAVVTSSFILSLLLSAVFFFSIYSLVALLLAFLCITLYNVHSKHFFGMEYILGAGVFSYGLFGAFTVSDSISPLAIVLSAVGFMQWLFSVGVSANVKDVEFDSKLGIRTTPIMFGVHVSDKKLVIPASFKVYAFVVKLIHILIASLPFFLGYVSVFVYGLPIPGVCFLMISLIMLYLTQKILSAPLQKRDTMLIYVGLQEGLALLLLPVALMSYLTENVSVLATFLLLLLFILWPLFWFRVLFGKRMIPLE